MENEFYLGVFTQIHSETKKERLMCSLDVNNSIITLIISMLENNTFTVDYITVLNISELLGISTVRTLGLLSKTIHEFKSVDGRNFNFGFNLPDNVVKELEGIVKNSQL